jgi:hypothetical protein
MSGNAFNGWIPEELFQATKLRIVYVQYQHQQQQQQPSITAPDPLVCDLGCRDLSFNKLQGTISTSIGKLKALETLYAWHTAVVPE